MQEGLIKGGMEPQQQPESQEGEEQSNVTSEEQAIYKDYVMQAAAMVYDEKASQELLGILGQTGNIEEGVANMAFLAVTQLDEANGGNIPEELILPVAEDIIEMVIELAEAKTQQEISEDQYAKISQLTVLRLMEEYGVDEEDMQAALEGIDPEMMKSMANETSARFGGEQVFPSGG